MALHLTLTYVSGADLRAYLLDQVNHGAVLVPVEGDLSTVTQFGEALLEVTVGEARASLGAQVLQVLPGTGIVLQLKDPKDLAALAESAGPAQPIQAPPRPGTVEGTGEEAQVQDLDAPSPEAEDGADGADGRGPRDPLIPVGSSPVSWSIELLVSRWDQLTLAERIRVARYGNRPARGMVLRGVDRTLHIHILQNPGLTLEEVTIMAGMANLDPITLQRIASSVDWQKQASVAKALLTNPKLPQTFVPRLLKNVPRDDLSRLARTGKVRASIKEAIVKHLDRTR